MTTTAEAASAPTSRHVLVEMGFYDSRREPDRLNFESAFLTASSDSKSLTYEQFKADMLGRGLTSVQTEAAFKTFDVNSNGVIDKYEYAIARACITDYVHERDNVHTVYGYVCDCHASSINGTDCLCCLYTNLSSFSSDLLN
jgi:hypothetical protein